MFVRDYQGHQVFKELLEKMEILVCKDRPAYPVVLEREEKEVFLESEDQLDNLDFLV